MMTHIRSLIAVVLVLWAATGLASPLLEWDSRLDELQVTVSPASDCESGCWRLVSARYENDQESGGLHHVWARMLDTSGAEIEGAPWAVVWPDGSQALQTKAPGEWADYPLWSCYAPFEGQAGPYSAYAGNDASRSDRVLGMGLPYCFHVNFRLVWQWDQGGPVEPLEPRLWIPLAGVTDD